MDQKKLDQQSQHWENSFLNKPEMFGLEPSKAAIKALELFKKKNIRNIIELGAGLGRDTIFFAKNSIYVEALDYSKTSIQNIKKKSVKLNLNKFLEQKGVSSDPRVPLVEPPKPIDVNKVTSWENLRASQKQTERRSVFGGYGSKAAQDAALKSMLGLQQKMFPDWFGQTVKERLDEHSSGRKNQRLGLISNSAIISPLLYMPPSFVIFTILSIINIGG